MNARSSASHLVFISHSGTDTWVAKQLARWIESCGAQAFLAEDDLDIHGEDFEEELRNALDRANELVVLLTPWALDRLYLWAEVGAFWNQRKPIISLLHGLTPLELQARPRVPILLKKRVMLDLNNVDRYFERLRVKVGRTHTEEEREDG